MIAYQFNEMRLVISAVGLPSSVSRDIVFSPDSESLNSSVGSNLNRGAIARIQSNGV